MGSIWKASHLGYALMAFSPVIAIGFGWEAFFPVALTSLLGGVICFMGQSVSTDLCVGQLTAELVQDLVFADKDRRDLVLAGLTAAERNWFLAELPRAKAELRCRQGQPRADWCTSVRWCWRLRYS
jgi:hypothetical protein